MQSRYKVANARLNDLLFPTITILTALIQHNSLQIKQKERSNLL